MRAFRLLRVLTSPLALAALSYALVSPASAATLYPNPIADTASHPGGVVTADFNSDGRLDAAVATDDGVDVLLGRGDGSFAPAVHSIGGAQIPGEGNPLVQADFDGDGRIDLLVPGMALFKGRGDGTFDPPVQAIFFSGFALAAGDLNGDDAPDLAMLNADGAGPHLCVLFNSGTGQFGALDCYGAATAPTSLAIADFNGDGHNDIAVTDGSNVAIRLGSGGGSFAAPISYPNTGHGIATADLNRDGILDLLTVFSVEQGINSYQGFVHVMLGSGLGSFGDGGSYPTVNRFPGSPRSGDFNGDGLPDVAAAGDLGLDILRGAGDGSLGTAEHYFADGETSDDIQGATAGSPDTDFSLRAERSAAASGRTYLVTYRAVDGAGNTTTSTLPVQVPHDLDSVVDPLTLHLSETGAGTLIQWDPVPGAVEYDIAAGDIGFFLDPTVSFGPPVCYAGHLMTTSNTGFELLDVPAPGTGFFFVVQYRDTARRGYGTENSPYDLTPLVPEDICP